MSTEDLRTYHYELKDGRSGIVRDVKHVMSGVCGGFTIFIDNYGKDKCLIPSDQIQFIYDMEFEEAKPQCGQIKCT